jgi:hypothetical protein
MKWKAPAWEKLLPHIFDNRFTFNVHKECLQLDNEKTMNSMQKNGHFTKRRHTDD